MKRSNRLFYIGISSIIALTLILFVFYDDYESSFEFNENENEENEEHEMEFKKSRAEYFFNMLRDPATNSIPEGIREKELAFAKKLPSSDKALRKGNNLNDFTWKEAGPTDVGGRTRALAIDVNNSNTIIAGGVSGGIWKTTNNGTDWKSKSSTLNDLSVTSIVQDKRSGKTNNWYYSTGEFDGNSASDRGYRAVFRGSGIYKSTDNGESWNRLNSTYTDPTSWDTYFDYVTKVELSPTTGTLFLASNGYGIVRSTNDNDFSLVLGGAGDHYYSDIVANKNGVLIAAISEYAPNTTKANSPGIYKSTNDGIDWTNITPASFPSNHQRTVLAVSYSNPNIVYAFTNTGETSGDDEVLKFFKLDLSNGQSFDRSANLPDFRNSNATNASRGYLTTQGCYDMVLAVKPDDENFVLIGGTNLFRSYDGFATKPTDVYETWIGGYGSEEFIHPNNHPDQHALVFDINNPDILWNGHDGGLSRSSYIMNSGYGFHFPWADKNKGYNVTQFYTIAMPYAGSDYRLMGGSQDNGSPYFTFKNSVTSTSQDISSGDGAFCYFGTGHYGYVSSQTGKILRLRYDRDGRPNQKSGWSYVYPTSADGQLFIDPFIVDHSDTNIVYYLAGNDMWRNSKINKLADNLQDGTDEGWTNIYTAPSNYVLTCLNVTRNNPKSTLYLGAYYSEAVPKIFKLENATTSSSAPVEIPISSAASGSYPHNIAINPDNGNEIIVVFSNYKVKGLFHSTDGGATYESIEGNLEGSDSNPGPSMRCASILPSAAGSLYMVGTSTGLYVTTMLNGDNTVWAQEGSNIIGNTVVSAVESRKADGRIAVATHGRGMFVADGVVVGVDGKDETIVTDYSLAQNYPNPFNPSTVIKYNLPEVSEVVLKIYDAAGREVKTLVNGKQSSGIHRVTFNASGLASGMYVYSIQAGTFKESKKMMLVK